REIWSGKRDSNSRPQPWQGCALPTELFPLILDLQLRIEIWSEKRDSNSRPQPWQGCALPAELFSHVLTRAYFTDPQRPVNPFFRSTHAFVRNLVTSSEN